MGPSIPLSHIRTCLEVSQWSHSGWCLHSSQSNICPYPSLYRASALGGALSASCNGVLQNCKTNNESIKYINKNKISFSWTIKVSEVFSWSCPVARLSNSIWQEQENFFFKLLIMQQGLVQKVNVILATAAIFSGYKSCSLSTLTHICLVRFSILMHWMSSFFT